MNPRNQAGLTWVELIAGLAILLILVLLLTVPVNTHPIPFHQAKMSEALSNMKQLHLMAQQMMLDGTTTKGNTNLGWPGDTGGSFSNWTAQLLKGGYATTNELCKLLSAPGLSVPPGRIPPMNETAVRVYAVRDDSPGSAVIFTSANFTNTPAGGEALNSSAEPFGTNGFLVFRKGGDGAVLRSKVVGQTNAIGSFVPMCR